MDERERFDLLEKEKIDKEVYFYLKDMFENLNIEIVGRYQGKLFELMKSGKLEGWCWQTTETAALFMPDDVAIYRGDLYFNKYKTYYHGFIVFNYKDKDYVFDPCFCMINTADLYFNTFEVDVKGFTTAKEIKEFFINYINNPPKKYEYCSKEAVRATDRFMRKFFGDDYLEKREPEVVIHDKEDPFAPMYRNSVGYKKINIENNKIKSLVAHYYIGG